MNYHHAYQIVAIDKMSIFWILAFVILHSTHVLVIQELGYHEDQIRCVLQNQDSLDGSIALMWVLYTLLDNLKKGFDPECDLTNVQYSTQSAVVRSETLNHIADRKGNCLL